MTKRLDVLFVEADSSLSAYQGLSETYSAIETPTWSLLLAQSCRAKGFNVGILDCVAERLSDEIAVKRIIEASPRFVLFVGYGQNPNSGTTSMIGIKRLSSALRNACPGFYLGGVGSHMSALPKESLLDTELDFVLIGEGVYALHDLLCYKPMESVAGLAYKDIWDIVINGGGKIVPQELMDEDLPGYAWDLLPDMSLYRSHFWHAGFNHERRTPFAAIYTSLGCKFACSFCMINLINRTDASPGVVSSDSRGMRYWSTEFILKELKKLSDLGVETVRISDEMFFLDKKHYEPLLQGIIDSGLKFNMWAYSRVDTVKKEALALFKKAGINWLALGIEAGSQSVRKEVSKGTFKDINIREVVASVRDVGINVISNYIFGLPDDNLESMQQTLDLALELNTEMVNMYPCQALPGSPLSKVASENGWVVPNSYAGYAFLSYESQPLPTKHLTAKEVIEFRDNAFNAYFTHEPYLRLVEDKFGINQRRNLEDMTKIKLKRKLTEDANGSDDKKN